MSGAPIYELRGVRKAFQTPEGEEAVILQDVDINLQEGEILALLGRSGSGKSTLLRIMAGLVAASSGAVSYRGQRVEGPVPGVAMVFQNFALFPWLTVLQNVELGLEALRIPQGERRRRALEAIDLIGLDGFESAYPRELSGGMRQRVGFARALVINPDVLLMDEPFSALDVLTAETLRTDLLDLWSEHRISTCGILLVSHNIEEAVLMADRILIFGTNPSQVRAEIAVKLPLPRDQQADAFRKLVGEIYLVMTARPTLPADKARQEGQGLGIAYHLPHVSVNRLAGLLESLAALEAAAPSTWIHLPELAKNMRFSVDDLFPLLDALEILGFAQVGEGQVELTSSGRDFVNADVQERKTQFTRHLLERVPLAAYIRTILDERPKHVAPIERFLEELEDHLSEEDARQVMETVIFWGRYAEIFAYDDNPRILSLENPGV